MKSILTVAVLVVLSGTTQAQDKVTANDLKQIGLAYHNHIDSVAKAPAKAEDLAPYFDNSKKLLDHLKTKRIEFYYGVTIAQMTEGTSNTILAFEQAAPDKGGLVLFGDGSVKKLTAGEFEKAPKAGKK